MTPDSNPADIWQAVQNGLLRGATSIGLEWAAQELDIDPLISSLSTAAMAGALEALLEKRNPLQGVYDSYFKAGTGLLTLGGNGGDNPWAQAVYISQVLDFNRIIQERGIVPAFETYAIGFLHQTTINEIWKQGGIAQMLLNPNQVEITTNAKGEVIKRIYASEINSEIDKTISNYIDLSLNDDRLMGYREGNVVTHCEFVIGPDGRAQLKNGEREILADDGKTILRREIIQDFKLAEVIRYNKDGILIEEISSFDAKGVQFNEQGFVTHGVRKNYVDGVTTMHRDGHVVYLAIERPYIATQEEIDMFKARGYDEEDIANFRTKFAYYAGETIHKKSVTIYDKDGKAIQIAGPDAILINEKYVNAFDLAIKLASDIDPRTTITLDRARGVAKVDMFLNWLTNPSVQIDPANPMHSLALEISKYISSEDANWYTAVQDAVPIVGSLLVNNDASFIFIPGVNSSGPTMDQLAQLKNSLQTIKTVIVGHSAGTEVAIREMFMAKADKYMILSPRMSPDALRAIMTEAGVRSDQVIVVTAKGDFPNWPGSYNDSGGKYWTNIYIESGPDVGTFMSGDSHGVPINGWLNTNNEYIVKINGETIVEPTALEIVYRQEVNK